MTQYPIAEVRERLKADIARGAPWTLKGDGTKARVEALLTHLDAVEGENARLRGESEREDKAHGVTIDQRDAAEAALSQAYFLVIGRSPPWSNVFNCTEALDEIDDAQSLLRQASARAEAAESQLASQAASLAEMREKLEAIDAMPHYVAPIPEGHVSSLHKRYERALDLASQALQNKAES